MLLAKVKQGQVNETFHAVLESGDVNLVEALCARLDETVICNSLTQQVLLSLIQQLTFSFEDANVCLPWISEAALKLNPTDPAISAYTPQIFGEAISRMEALAAERPSMRRSLRSTMVPLRSGLAACRNVGKTQ
jgi:hypothetical protein